MNIYYYLMHCNSIGDNLASFRKHYLTYKLAKENNCKIVSIVHMCTTEEMKEYIIKQNIILDSFSLNTNLMDLYKKANLFENYTIIEGINDRVYSNYSSEISRIIKNFYGNKHTKEITFIEQYPNFWNICYDIKKDEIINFFKNQYKFLKKDTIKEYNIIQYCSNHYDLMSKDIYDKCVKRISFDNLCDWIEQSNLNIFKFIGSYHDYSLTNDIINRLITKYPNYVFLNLCGENTLEETYSLIYNCKSLLCTESFSGFFAGLLDIPSVMYYRYTNLEVMNQFIPQFSILNSLKIKLDIELTVND